LGETVGKSPDGLPGEVTPRLGSGGSDTGGTVLLAGGGVALGVRAGAAMTTAAAEARKVTAPLAAAVATSLICWPEAAAFRTLTLTCNSSDWPAGSFPRSQVGPILSGQTVNCGESTPLTRPMFTLTITSWLFGLVLQIQIAYVAVRPEMTRAVFEKS
jgi:hypothetical protein